MFPLVGVSSPGSIEGSIWDWDKGSLCQWTERVDTEEGVLDYEVGGTWGDVLGEGEAREACVEDVGKEDYDQARNIQLVQAGLLTLY